MSEPRTLTAAELAADGDAARAVWAAWGRKEVDITTAFFGEPVLGVKTAPNGDVTLRTGTGWRLEAGSIRLHIRPRVPAPPTYGELQAERDTLARIVAAVEAVLATLPEKRPTLMSVANELYGDKPADYIEVGRAENTLIALWRVGQQFKRAIVRAREGGEGE